MAKQAQLHPEWGRWGYGDAGDRWPVRPGEVWSCGDHLIACADLEGSGPLAARPVFLRMLGSRQPAACFVDPPWNPGNAQSFRTKAAVSRAVDFPHLLSKVAELAALAPDVWVEMGVSGDKTAARIFTAAGLTLAGSHDATYYHQNPCRLLRFTGPGFVGAPLTWEWEHPPDDEELPGLAFSGLPLRSTVIDPCIGRGLAAVAAHSLGLVIVGVELHPRRAAVTLDKLHKLGAGMPARVPELENR